VANNTEGAELENASEHTAQLAIQGPKAVQVLQKLTRIDLASIPYYSFTTGEFAGVKEVIISNTGYTGAGGFELYFYPEFGEQIWNAIFEAGQGEGIKPCGLGCRDTLRLEMGFCLYGNDIDDNTSPIAAGLGWITKFVDGKDFISRNKIEADKKNGTAEKLVGFKLSEKGIARHGYEIVNDKGETIGCVTSGSISPCLKEGIGLGYVAKDYAKVGSEIFIKVRNKNLKANVVKLPFITK
jgi:aminomethyltransferase